MAPKHWYDHLRSALIDKLGFTESAIDPCLLYKKNLLLVLYVDDLAMAAPDMDTINNLISDLKHLGLELDLEDDFASFLGIGIETKKVSTIV